MHSILIAEDDDDLRFLILKMLRSLGFDLIYFVSNGLDAIKTYREFSIMNKKPDLIIMDYQMPRKNGIEATKEILEIDYTAIIIISSCDDSIKKKALSVGACDFLCKPFKIKELSKVLTNNLLKRKREVKISF